MTALRRAAVLVLTVLLCWSAATAREPPSELAILADAWLKLSDFQAVIAGHESDGKTTESRTFRYSFLRPNHAKLEMLDGPSRGMTVVWNGGDRVVAYKRGIFSCIKLTFALHDKIVSSLRGNTLATPDLSQTLRCFQAKGDEVVQGDGPQVNGDPTIVLVLEDKNGLHCPGDPPEDIATVTKDVIYLSRATHLPVRRVRFAGDTQVESWDLSDLRVNTGLSSKDFP